LCLLWVERVLDAERGFEGLVVRRGVIRGEGDVVLRVPVFGCDLYGERVAEELVDGRYDVACAGYC
jgi:hypothetical protein